MKTIKIIVCLYSVSIRDEATTLTDDKAIAAAAIHGWIVKPQGIKTPKTINNKSRLKEALSVKSTFV